MRSILTVPALLTLFSTAAYAATATNNIIPPLTPSSDQLYLGIISFVVVAGIAVWLGRSTDMLRDSQPIDFGGAKSPAGKEYRRPYSLAQSQMTWWFCIIIASYVYIACIRHVVSGVLVEQSLILMGIGAGTALGAAIIEQTKQGENPTLDQFTQVLAQINGAPSGTTVPTLLIAERDELAAKLASESFFKDLLTDVDGVSLHRFQSVLWTAVLGAFFVVNVVTTLTMPQFDNLLLATLGISGATYLGFKIPEQPA